MKNYTIIEWPKIQDLMDLEGFEENAYLINDEKGIENFGSSAYFVNTSWLKELHLYNIDDEYIKLLKDEIEAWKGYAIEIVENQGIQWENDFLKYDYSPPIDNEAAFADFEYFNGGFNALTNLLNKI